MITSNSTAEERRAERAWIIRNRLHPECEKRLKAYNDEIRRIKKEATKARKAKAKEFKVGEIVKVNHPKARGLFKVVKVKISMVLLKQLETQRNFDVQSHLIEKIEKEDSDLISELDEIGL